MMTLSGRGVYKRASWRPQMRRRWPDCELALRLAQAMVVMVLE